MHMLKLPVCRCFQHAALYMPAEALYLNFWIVNPLSKNHAGMQAAVLPPQAQLVKGDVYQFSTLERAVADSNIMFIATGSRPALDPFGPFNIDYQVRVLALPSAMSPPGCAFPSLQLRLQAKLHAKFVAKYRSRPSSCSSWS